MAGSIDYAQLRDHTLGSGQDEEAVTVNTRALIDKVLARYSGEWTTLRELIQNAADASATTVKIKFETLPSASVPLPQTTDQSAHLKHTILNHTLKRLLVSNNGQPFAETDWARLKRIAEGNPDETKIGAFGVGFYSVFSECESPFVTSGKQSMAFYWKGNSLFTRRGKLPDDVASNDTCFVLDYRNSTTAIPNLMSICQFLSTSLTFVGLENIELWLDDWNVFSLKKKSAPGVQVSIPKDIETRTKEGMMRITGVESQNAQIDASWINIVGWTPVADRAPAASQEIDPRAQPSLRSFFSRLTGSATTNAAAKRAAKEEEALQQAIADDISGKSQATVFIRVNTVSIKSQVSSSFAAELERATKKPPPKNTRIAILTSSYDETEASMSTLTGTASKKVAGVILSALPSKNGRIFIGFPTAQTSGLLAHISAPSLIPTVERESIDLNARYVRSWNQELLSVAGIACRIAYTGEMAALRDKLSAQAKSTSGVISEEQIKKVMPVAVHILKQFTFKESTPLPKAGQIIEESFWTCNKKASIEILSSCGVLPSHQVRIASEDLSFVKGLPVVPEKLLEEAREYVTRLQEYGLISEITTSDIKKELEKQALSESQLEEFLKWAAQKTRGDQIDPAMVQTMFSVTVVNLNATAGSQANDRLLVLGSVKTFVNSSRLAPELPMPAHTIPFRFTKGLNMNDLSSFGWDELQTVPWLRWLVEGAVRKTQSKDTDLTQTPAFAAQVLQTVSKNWDGLSQGSKNTVSELLSDKAIIPTRLGMRKPPDSYFPSVRLFDDLPVISNLSSVKEKFLKSLGVRKTIELAVIFDRLMDKSDVKSDAKDVGWSHVDLVRYLVSVWNDIPEQDINQLRNTALCPAEVTGDKAKGTRQRFKMAELFEPKDSLRALGLPVLQWPGQYNAYSSDGKFLKLLGLRAYPSVPEIIDILAKAQSNRDIATYEAGLRYFIENHYQNNYAAFDLTGVQVAFLPLEGSEKQVAVKPEECFTNPKANVLGFKVLRQDLQLHADKFGVRENPPMHECAIRLLRTPPQTRQDAKALFGYFAGRLGEISPNVADRLGSAAIVPILSRSEATTNGTAEKSKNVRLATPVTCFLGDDEEYRDIFDYVDFGQEPNMFLLKIGSKHEPSTIELTRLLVREPARIFQTLKVEKYQGLLRKLQVNMATLKKDKVLWKDMKRLPFLLAYTERRVDSKGVNSRQETRELVEEDDDDPSVKEWHLRSADQIIIVNDLICYSLFKEFVVAAPQEESIEDLYSSLGTPNISDLVIEEPRLGPRQTSQKSAERLYSLILERAQLFLHEQPSSTLRHDAKWLEKHLEVQCVQSVSLRRTLRGYNQSHNERRSAAIAPHPSSRNRALLSITAEYDMWQVSQEIIQLLLDRPKTQHCMVFEMFLTTDLRKLRSRGYNVDRVLRRKAAEEARIAELDKQRKEEEVQKQSERVKEESTRSPQGAHAPEEYADAEEDHGMGQVAMPGAFHDSPDRTQQPKKNRGLFSTLTKHLGFDDRDTSPQSQAQSQQLQNFLGGNTPSQEIAANGRQNPNAPPPYSPYDPNGMPTQSGQGPAEAVTAPSAVNNNLQKAVSAARAHTSSTLFSRPETNNVKEVASYCDSRPGHDLQLAGMTSSGIQVYVSKTSLPNGGASFVQSSAAALDAFAQLLLEVAGVFGLRKESMHIFLDTAGNTIAFNQGGSLFANFRFFAQLHGRGVQEPQGHAQALVYWWVVMCHELAHNLVADHSADHSYYTEQFVASYFPAVAGRLVAGSNADARGLGAGPGATGLTGLERAFS